MTTSNLIHLIYSSHATKFFSENDLVELLKTSRQNNSKADLTGILLHEEGDFFQVLEGQAQNVESLFHILKQDPRHVTSDKYIDETVHAFLENNLSPNHLIIEITEASIIHDPTAFVPLKI